MTEQTINSQGYGIMVLMLKRLLEAEKISVTTANLTTERIAKQNELKPIYLW